MSISVAIVVDRIDSDRKTSVGPSTVIVIIVIMSDHVIIGSWSPPLLSAAALIIRRWRAPAADILLRQ
jgi:hypothetical protein